MGVLVGLKDAADAAATTQRHAASADTRPTTAYHHGDAVTRDRINGYAAFIVVMSSTSHALTMVYAAAPGARPKLAFYWRSTYMRTRRYSSHAPELDDLGAGPHALS